MSTVLAQAVTFTYQGLVTDNGTNFTGTGQFKFALVISTNASSQATARAFVTNGFMTSINVVSGGSGYTTTPTVAISGGGGAGATATASIFGGSVTAITVNNAGSGYTSTPTVTIAAPPPAVTYVTYWSNDGTSIAGSQPSAAVNVTVNQGLFTVALGDTNQPNMDMILAALFNQPKLQLRIWFSDGVNGFAALDPVQNLTPVPYAIASVNLPSVVVQPNSNGSLNVIEGKTIQDQAVEIADLKQRNESLAQRLGELEQTVKALAGESKQQQ